MFIISESPTILSKPLRIQKSPGGKDWIRMESIIQTANEINKNKRRYSKNILEMGLKSVLERIKEGSLLGELDHPVDTRPARQVTVLFKEASHRILDTWWDGNKLCACIESLNTPNGNILKNLAIQGVPVGWSFRGMGDVATVNEGGQNILDVRGPLHVITWDSVSNPSHAAARLIKITEDIKYEINNDIEKKSLTEGCTITHECGGIIEKDGLICTNEGICYLPNQFDEFVNKRIIKLIGKYKGI